MKRACPLCASTAYENVGSKGEFVLRACSVCSFLYLANEFDYRQYYDETYFKNYHNPQALTDSSHIREGSFSYLENEQIHLDTYETMFGLLRRFTRLTGAHYLDVGCAGGSGLKVAARYGAVPYGVDVSEEALALCRSQGFTNLFLGELSSVIERDFDVVTLHDVLEHMQDPHANISALSALMKIGGLVYVKNNVFSRDKFRNDPGYFDRQFEPPYHCSYFSEELMLKIFREHGFKLVYRKPRWVQGVFETYGFLKRLVNPSMRAAHKENKLKRLSPDDAKRYSKGAGRGQWLNARYPSGFVFRKLKEETV